MQNQGIETVVDPTPNECGGRWQSPHERGVTDDVNIQSINNHDCFCNTSRINHHRKRKK